MIELNEKLIKQLSDIKYRLPLLVSRLALYNDNDHAR